MDNIQLAAYLKDEVSPTLSNISKKIDTMESKFQKMGKGADKASSQAKKSFGGVSDSLVGMASGFIAAKMSIDVFGQAMSAITEAAKWEKLQKAIDGIEGSAKAGGMATERLLELSKMPGLGFESVQKGYLAFRGLGVSVAESERMIKNFGNAIATMGGGAEEFERVQRQLGQMIGKNRILQEDITVISESMPNFNRLVKDAFGTMDIEAIRKSGISASEFVSRITDAAEKLPPATVTLGDAIDDLSTSWSRFKASTVDTGFMKNMVSGVSTALNDLTDLFSKADAKLNKTNIFKAWLSHGGPIGIFGMVGVAKAAFRGDLVNTGAEVDQKRLEDLKRTYEKALDPKRRVELSKQIASLENKITGERLAQQKIAGDTKSTVETGSTVKSTTKGTGKSGAQKKEDTTGVLYGVDLAENERLNNNWNVKNQFAQQMGVENRIIEGENAANKAIEDARIASEKTLIDAKEQFDNIKNQFIQGIAGGMEGVFANAFMNIGKKGHDLFDDLLEGFKMMLIQMAAEMAAKAVVFGLFNMFSGGAGFGGVGKSGSFLTSILGGASASTGAVPSLSPVASAGGVNLTVNLSGGATKRDATTIANTLAAAQRGRLVGAMA